MISASAIERVDACPGSEAYPHAHTTSEYAEIGTLVHRFVERAAEVGRNTALAELEQHVHDFEAPADALEICEVLDLDALPDVSHEVMLVYDTETDTAREVGRGSDRAYGDLTPTEIPGTADFLGLDGDAVFVADLKSLWGDVTPPDKNPQLAFLALAAARLYGKDRAVVQILRRGSDGTVYPETATLDVLDLDAFAARLRTMLVRVAEQKARAERGIVPDVREGSHCRYCPATLACPAKTALVKRMATGEEWQEILAMTPLTAEMASRALDRLKPAKQMLATVEKTLKACAAAHPIPRPGGKVWGPRRVPGNEVIDGGVAYRVVEDLYGREVAERCVTHKASKAAIERALRDELPEGEKLAPEMRKVLARIRDENGADKPETTKYEEYTPRLEE